MLGVQTFVLADVRGYTRFTQEHGDEAGARLASRFAVVVREEIESSGGTVVELRGDEALCAFRSPRQALRAAVGLQRRCAEEIRSDPSLPLRVGVGVDAGEAVPVEGGYRGGALNLAARLCALAKAGEVLVSEGTVLLAHRVEEVEYVDRGRVELKGMREPVRYYQARFELDLPPEEQEPRFWSRRRVATAGLAVAASAAAALGFVLTRGSPKEVTFAQNGLVELTADRGKLVAERAFASPPGGLAFGLGRAWVTDPASARLVSVLPGGSAGDIAPTGGSPSTAVTVAGGSIWAVDSEDSSVIKLDAKLLTPVDRIRVGAGADAIAASGTSVWVANAQDGTVQRIDTTTDRASDPVGVGAEPTALAVGLGSVWVADTGNGTLVQIDSESRRVLAIASVGAGPDAVAVADGKIWVANGPENAVTRFDPRNPNAQRKIAIAGAPVALAASGGTVWVATRTGSIDRIDPNTLAASPTRQLGIPIGALVAADGRLWATTTSTPSSHHGGTLRVGVTDPLDSLDPATAYFAESLQLLSLTNDGLVSYRRVGGAAGTLLVPDLATALPSPTDHGRTYRFVLRKGIRYSTGRPVRASDFRRSLERALTAKGSPAPQFLSQLVGASKCSPAHCDLSGGVVADDAAGTVTFHLTTADPSLPAVLALPFTFPLPPGVGPPESGKPVPATGPYRIARVSMKKTIVLERNPRFRVWSTEARPNGFPDRIVWRIGLSSEQQIAQVEHGSLDVALGRYLASTPQAAGLTKSRFASQVHVDTELATQGWFMNTRTPPFDDVRVRRAVNYAIDRRRASAVAGGISGVSCQILPPSLAGYRPYCPYGRGGVPPSSYRGPDLARARRLVAASGTKGEQVTIAASAQATKFDGYLAGVLRSLGYRVRLNVVGDSSAYFPYIQDSRSRAQIGVYGWLADYPAPSDFLGLLFDCGSWKPGNPAATLDPSFFCDARVQQALTAARRLETSDPTRAPLAWARVDRLVTDLAPWAVAFTPRTMTFVSRRVGNFQYHPLWGPLLDQLWVR